MGQRRLTKKEIVDWIVAKAMPFGMFRGDKRDGEAPPITVQNFGAQSQRYGAKALRARLSRLSFDELLTEAVEVRAHLKAKPSQLAQFAERIKQEEAAQAHRQRQAELGRRHRLQPAILAAARNCQDQGMRAREAWDALAKSPFTTNDGSTVEIVGSKLLRLEQHMRVKSPGDGQQRRSISFTQWRQAYWSSARKAD